jgi:hypothetical protein
MTSLSEFVSRGVEALCDSANDFPSRRFAAEERTIPFSRDELKGRPFGKCCLYSSVAEKRSSRKPTLLLRSLFFSAIDRGSTRALARWGKLEKGVKNACSDTALPDGPTSVEEVTRKVDEEFIPIIKDADGFLAYYVVNVGAGEVATVSVFEDQVGAEESIRMAADWIRQNLAALLPNPPEITAGEVVTHELNLTKLGVSKVRK